ncbi:hypothetical protein CIPAW_09G043400 [Carya illinoinensis]|uniref:Uncharacterized protein n=1 Tax=Carya illinoinensis TaxID=32201 RepID=A0A8T1PH04_CARIL|nr:hypothetical protein CIPAW_09G043400 [Carya illinoinensis]KAG6694348.1 hypothetical protein I3842_09G043400 [Carya illinoinensis]
MAGLQYNFFPTDFYYPRTTPVNADSSSSGGGNNNMPVALRVQPPKVDADGDDVPERNKLCCQLPPPSTALVPSPCIIKSELRRKKAIIFVSNCSKN